MKETWECQKKIVYHNPLSLKTHSLDRDAKFTYFIEFKKVFFYILNKSPQN